MRTISFKDNDYLEREKLADDIETYAEMLQKDKYRINESVSIALDSSWGTGKTFFLEMWANRLNDSMTEDERAANHLKALYFNAWDWDDCESPLLPFTYDILDKAFSMFSLNDTKRAKAFLKAVFIATAKVGIERVFGENEDLVKIFTNGVDAASDDKAIEGIYQQYKEYRKFNDSLNEGLVQLRTEVGNLWIFIDDLDRCRPEFALALLEGIKHLFNIKQLVFVFSLDIAQLSRTIANKYKEEVDSELYLLKFFDNISHMPSPDISKYVVKKMAEIEEWHTLMNMHAVSYTGINGYLVSIYEKWGFSLREINMNISHLHFFLIKNKAEINLLSEDERVKTLRIYIFFLALRDKDPEVYGIIVRKKYSVDSDGKSEQFDTEKYVLNPKLKDFLFDFSKESVDKLSETMASQYGFLQYNTRKTFAQHLEEVMH